MPSEREVSFAAVGVLAEFLDRFPSTKETRDAVEALDVLARVSTGLDLRGVIELLVDG